MYAHLFNDLILRVAASGLNLKIENDMTWDLQRSDTQQLLDSTNSKKFNLGNVVERKLNLADTEGMFLLMAVGYIIAGSVLVSEMVGGCAKTFRQFVRRQSKAIISFGRNVSRRSSVASIEDGPDPPVARASFTENLRRRYSKQLRRKSSTEISSFLKKMFGQNGNQSEKNEESIDVPDHLNGRHKREENIFPDNHDIDGEVGSGDVIDVRKKDFDANSMLGSSSVGSKSHVITEEHTAEVIMPTIENRDDNASKEFGEPVNCQ